MRPPRVYTMYRVLDNLRAKAIIAARNLPSAVGGHIHQSVAGVFIAQ